MHARVQHAHRATRVPVGKVNVHVPTSASQVWDLTMAMLEEGERPQLSYKGKETHGLFGFAIHLLNKYAETLEKQRRINRIAGVALAS